MLILFHIIQDNLTWDVPWWRYAILVPIDLVLFKVILDE